jgi:hypothetical protein
MEHLGHALAMEHSRPLKAMEHSNGHEKKRKTTQAAKHSLHQ